MKIQCYSKDKVLLEKLLRHFGDNSLTMVTETNPLPASDLDLVDVAIIDLKYNSLSDGELLNCPVISLAEIPNFSEAQAALKVGVRGYGNRQMRLSNLEQAIESVLEGQIWLPPSIISSFIEVIGQNKITDRRKRQGEFIDLLSKREQEVALCVAKGLSNQGIADKLYISLRTVKAHISSIYEKTGVRNRLELALSLS